MRIQLITFVRIIKKEFYTILFLLKKFNMGIMNFYTSKDIALSRVMSGKNRNIKYKYQIIKNINY